jgi:hypothetical protein
MDMSNLEGNSLADLDLLGRCLAFRFITLHGFILAGESGYSKVDDAETDYSGASVRSISDFIPELQDVVHTSVSLRGRTRTCHYMQRYYDVVNSWFSSLDIDNWGLNYDDFKPAVGR